MLYLVAQSCPTLCDPMDCSPPGSSVHGDFPGKNTGVGSLSLLQRIFPTQGLNPGLSHCRRILYCLNQQESPFRWIEALILIKSKSILSFFFLMISALCILFMKSLPTPKFINLLYDVIFRKFYYCTFYFQGYKQSIYN